MSKLNLSEFLIECTNIESTTGNEGMFATFLATFMRNHGWKVIEQNVENDRKNLLIYLESVKNVQTVFCSHLDTVEPYIAPKREGEIIWGRGSNDAKGQISAMIAMALDLQAKSIEIAKKIGLLFTVDEELDRCGIKKTNEIEELNPEYFIIGEPTENHWGTIQKGGLKVHLKVTGKAGHSSYPDTGESAIHKLVEVLGDISKHSWPKKETGATTFNIGYIEGGEKSVPATWASKASAIIFFRTVTSNSEVLAELKRLIKDRAECEILVNVEPEYLMSRPEAFNQIPLAPIPFTTDLCHYQRKSNFKGAVVYGAGSAKNAHSEHEHVKLCDLEEAVKVYANLATYFSGASF